MAIAAVQAVAPGQPLGDADKTPAGRGTYVESGKIFACVTGQKKRKAENSALEVLPEEELASNVPEVGSIVLARIVRMSQDRAECVIVAVGSTALNEKFRGVIRKQDIRFFEVDKLQMTDAFRNGDFVRAQVLALGDSRSYVLSTAVSDNLGVILAKSEAGMPLSPISWNFMKCPLTGRTEKRKVAKPS
eukprot:TRINITY_DN79807_c0_g1_i1.p1 TRINITY_DN79807_c0_g1~~TRINITY_DN79807_c0_g1_i1.p1  ORF type:complete len:198 (+),score=37.81 TRINITY_DN79807_c0_g1_i1:28-594(+)